MYAIRSYYVPTVPYGKKVFIEIKGGTECLIPLKKILDRTQMKNEQIVIMDFDLEVVKKARALFPDYAILWLFEFHNLKL